MNVPKDMIVVLIYALNANVPPRQAHRFAESRIARAQYP